MAIVSVNSYPPTTREFKTHWSDVNEAQPQAPIVLPDGLTLQGFEELEAAMNAAFAKVVPASTEEREASAQLKIARTALQSRTVDFGKALRYYLKKSRFADMAPNAPKTEAGEGVYKDVGRKVLTTWADINAATDLAPFRPPLLLPEFDADSAAVEGGYPRARFETDYEAVLLDFDRDKIAAREATQARANRNALLPPIYDAMKAYREAVLLLLPKNSPFRPTLPRLTPAPGTTPPPLTVTGAWEQSILKARLSWLPIPPAIVAKFGIDKLQVRGCPNKYKNEDEEIIADLPVSALLWEGDWGLTAPGSIASFKVYAMTNTGNENGGKVVKIVRPYA